MTTESRAEFARRMGWNRSSVTRAAKDGRVVLAGEKVDVEASLRKIEALAHPAAHHQAHVRQLEEGRKAKAEGVEKPALEGIEELNLRLKRAEADKREHEAEMARMERETMAGNLIAREDVEFALDDAGAILRSLMENFADRVTPIVHPLQTFEEKHAANAEFAQEVLQTMNESLLKRAQQRRVA